MGGDGCIYGIDSAVTVSPVWNCLQTHPLVRVTCVQIFACNVIKWFLKRVNKKMRWEIKLFQILMDIGLRLKKQKEK